MREVGPVAGGWQDTGSRNLGPTSLCSFEPVIQTKGTQCCQAWEPLYYFPWGPTHGEIYARRLSFVGLQKRRTNEVEEGGGAPKLHAFVLIIQVSPFQRK